MEMGALSECKCRCMPLCGLGCSNLGTLGQGYGKDGSGPCEECETGGELHSEPVLVFRQKVES